MEIQGIKRLENIDIIKGSAIFLVVWGHCVQYMAKDHFNYFENNVFRFIYSFHMPLFIAVSGYLFYYTLNKYNFKQNIVRLIRSIFVTLIICNTVNFCYNILFEIIINKRKFVFIDIIKIGYSSLRDLWFLWTVLFCSIAVLIMTKLIKSQQLILIALICGYILLIIIPEEIEFAKQKTIWLYPYFVGGFLFNKYRYKISSKIICVVSILCGILLFLLLPNLHQENYIYTSGIYSLIQKKGLIYQTQINIFRWIIGAVGVVFITYIINLIHKVTNNKYCFIKQKIIFLGKNSLQIYILQNYIIEKLFSDVFKLLDIKFNLNWVSSNMIIYNYIITPLVTIVFLIIICLIIKILYKYNIGKLLFGR